MSWASPRAHRRASLVETDDPPRQTDNDLRGIILLDEIGGLIEVSPVTIAAKRGQRHGEDGLGVATGNAHPHRADVESQPDTRTHASSRTQASSSVTAARAASILPASCPPP